MALFVLDISRLSGDTLNYVETPLQEKGYSIVLDWEQDGADRDIRIVGHAIRAVAAESIDTDFPTSSIMGTGTLYGLGLYGAGAYGGITGGSGSGVFILDVSKLAGDVTVLQAHSPLQERGRAIQLE